jgi:hypothetical protein
MCTFSILDYFFHGIALHGRERVSSHLVGFPGGNQKARV